MNSKLEIQRSTSGHHFNIPLGPTFFPSVEEFEDNPLNYINKIAPTAQRYGICKIVPPAGWNPPLCVDMESKESFQTKEQLLHRIQEGISFGDGEEYCASDYIKMAQRHTKKWFSQNSGSKSGGGTNLRITPEELELAYWNIVENHEDEHVVDYGNDVDTDQFGSGFPRSERGRCVGSDADNQKENLPEPKFGTTEFYKESYWNLQNISNSPLSILRHIKVGINGINVPWLYFGNLFTTFCWHNEDNYLHSINYHHWGAPKQWYGIPGTKKDAEGLEKVFKDLLATKMRDEPDLLHHITTMFSPRLLQLANVPVYKILQHPGEFVVTFPRSFHGGFSMGPNIGEAVNFGTTDWIPFGADASERYRSLARPSVFSHDRLTSTLAYNLADQKSYKMCTLLIEELKKVYGEEMKLRSKLLESGVRDVSKDVSLPKNRLDHLDEESAEYDDKRSCHACKHVCFFSCIACECSESKVSCLRHSHALCRCPTERRYMLTWTTKEEFLAMIRRVEKFADKLVESESSSYETKHEETEMPPVSPGSLQDTENHKDHEVDMNSCSPLLSLPVSGMHVMQYFRNRVETTDEALKSFKFIDEPKEKKAKLNA